MTSGTLLPRDIDQIIDLCDELEEIPVAIEYDEELRQEVVKELDFN